MSWYVRQLILNEKTIISSIQREELVATYDGTLTSDSDATFDVEIILDFDSDSYMDLLSVIMTYERMVLMDMVTKRDREIFEAIRAGEYSYHDIENKFSIRRETASFIFRDICNNIAYLLGEHFTDDGYIEYLSEKFSLSDEHISKLTEKILRRGK